MTITYSVSFTGTVYLNISDYLVTGYHDVTIEAENHVTGSVVTETVTVDVLYKIVNPRIEITTPTWDSYLVHPGDDIRFNVSVDFASRVDISLLCSDGQGVSLHLYCFVYYVRLARYPRSPYSPNTQNRDMKELYVKYYLA